MKKWTRSDPVGPEKIQYFKVHAAMQRGFLVLSTYNVYVSVKFFILSYNLLLKQNLSSKASVTAFSTVS